MKALTILAATDFSKAAGDALERAAMTAARIGGGHLELMNVVHARSLRTLKRLLSPEAGPIETLLVEEATVSLRRAVEDLSTRFSIPVDSYVALGNPAEEIVARASELDSALLVIGGRGENAPRDLLLGTTAQKVIRTTQHHVLVVKQPAHNHYRSVLAATDFSECSLTALNNARVVAPDAVITTLHAFEAPFEGKLQHAGLSNETIARYRHQAKLEAENEARAFAENANLGDACVIRHGYPPKVIREHAQRLRPDLIAVGKHGHSRIEEWLLGSVSEHVLADAACDVLLAGREGRIQPR